MKAQTTLNRYDKLGYAPLHVQKFKDFILGTTYLMKRKFEQGIQILSETIDKYELGSLLLPLAFSFRAYGYLSISKFKECLQDFDYLESKQFTLDKQSQYNKLIALGSSEFLLGNLEHSVEQFKNAAIILPQKIQPLFFISLVYLKLHKNNLKTTKGHKYLELCENYAFQAFQKNPDASPHLNYFVGILNLVVGNIEMALEFFEKALDQAEENQFYFFQARGLAYGMNKQLENAINDLSFALELNPLCSEIYIQRMKYFQSVGQENLALKDLKSFVNLNGNDPQIHFLTGQLLQNQGAILEASLCYSNDPNMEFDENLLLNRYKCNIHLRQLDQALHDVQTLYRLTSKSVYSYDLVCLNVLKKISVNQYNDELINECEEMLLQIQNSLSGIIFNQQFTLNILGVIYVHQNKFQQALDIFFKYESNQKNLKDTLQNSFQDITNKQIQVQNSPKSLLLSQSSFEALVMVSREESSGSNIVSQDYTHAQNYFNVCLTYYKLENYKASWDYFQKMRQNMDPNLKIKTFELENLIHCKLNNLPINGDCEIDAIFGVTNKICQIFPQIQLENSIKASLIFDLPNVEIKTYNFDFNYSIIDQLKITQVENKGEAPWIKRSKINITFTDDIMNIDDLNLDDDSVLENNQQNNLSYSNSINQKSSILLSQIN